MSKKIVGDKVPSVPKMLRTTRITMARDIEENLKRIYNASLSDEVPDRFLKLLAELKDKEGKS